MTPSELDLLYLDSMDARLGPKQPRDHQDLAIWRRLIVREDPDCYHCSR